VVDTDLNYISWEQYRPDSEYSSSRNRSTIGAAVDRTAHSIVNLHFPKIISENDEKEWRWTTFIYFLLSDYSFNFLIFFSVLYTDLTYIICDEKNDEMNIPNV
jgi:hypothetical protein